MHDDLPARAVLNAAIAASLERQPGRILVAVSGGVDSLALLLSASEVAGGRLGVASLDHGLRPESAAEVAGVVLIDSMSPGPVRPSAPTPSPTILDTAGDWLLTLDRKSVV